MILRSWSLYLVLIVTFFAWSVQSSPAAQLIVADSQASAGGLSVSIPIELATVSGEEIAALQFDLGYDSSKIALETLNLGAAAQNAGKTVSSSNIFAGVVRIVIHGINNNVIPDGILVNVIIDIPRKASQEVLTLSLSQLVASDTQGDEVPLTAVNGSLTITPKESNGGDSGGGGGCFIGVISNVW